MVIVKFESRVDIGWYNRNGKKGCLCLVIARETMFDTARVKCQCRNNDMSGLVDWGKTAFCICVCGGGVQLW